MRHLVLLLACVATCTAAQPTQGDGAAPSAAQGAIRLLNAYARCVAATQPKIAGRILAAPFLSTEQTALASDDFRVAKQCTAMGKSLLERPAVGIIGGMAEEMYLRQHGRRPADAVVKAGAVVVPRDAAEDLALCLVRMDPTASRAVLAAQPATAEETTAIAQIVPHLGECSPEGSTMKFNKSTVRTLVAVGLYLSAERS